MEDNLTLEAWYEGLTARETELMRRGCRILISRTFIIKTAEREIYGFFHRNEPHLTAYFGMMGYTLFIELDYGIIMLRDRQAEKVEAKELVAVNKKTFTVRESIIYCTLAWMFMDRMESGIDRSVFISLDDLLRTLDQFGIKLGFKTDFNKTMLGGTMKMFERYSLVKIHGEFAQEDSTIELFPTLLFGMDLDAAAAFLKNKMQTYAGSSTAEEELADEEDLTEDENGADE